MLNKGKNIAVIGGGISGICAAISAAQEGDSVTLIEKSNMIGGNATLSNVGTICGAYLRSENDFPVLVGNDFTQEFITELLDVLEVTRPIKYHQGLHIIPYEWSVLKDFLMRKISDYPSIKLLMQTALLEVEVKEGLVHKVVTSNPLNKEIHCDAIIDCSGKAMVSELLNLALIESVSYQAAAQVFRVSNMALASEFSINMSIKKMMWKSIDELNWPECYKTMSVVPGSIRDGKLDIKLTLPDLITDSIDVVELAKNANQAIQEVFAEMCKQLESFENSKIERIFPEVGIRVLKRPCGKEVLTEQNVIQTEKPEQGVAVGTWPIEYWNENGVLELTTFKENEYYLISANSLISKEVGNLFFAGKNISATTKAIASARVIGTCIQTGYAAGKLASKQGRIESIVQLRNELKLGNEYI